MRAFLLGIVIGATLACVGGCGVEEGYCFFAVRGELCTATFCAVVGTTIDEGGGWWETDNGLVFDCVGDEGCQEAGRQAELACNLVPAPT